ncbi:RnfABCDGE type electron transport complex subunit G [Ancylomarina euxinus]|uniref:Ion-translocating oxidoreductase complex subunit G n=1 Tax=Ancylomarina euxinus TaxID=2283627 RepID=A0A425XWY6_9BACT|nr:RnfABCDGE type electron transport complex subunit G [Ancylomarina euxinus]MCZ4696230.1 RnfABCDGE type electron transport complex subunit G [Ancylomarina euxinus]MUP16605.1 RnfABCDGE type electron transport complex subunit G [Ancylomarina euxinus]RRG19168.1 RnfABCDGE type electron transport complex subunit G [Ancylomarina euxinus]
MAGKKESTFINMVLVLFIITLVASAALGGLYELTKEPIAKAKLNKKLKAIEEVVPAFDNNPSEEMYEVAMPSGDKLEFYPATMGGKLVGTAVKTFTTNGFSGYVWVMVGFKPDGTVNNYSVLEHKETPGLGTKMADWFKPVDPTKVKLSLVEKLGKLVGIKPAATKGGAEGDKKSIVGKNPGTINFTVSKDGGDIDAITAATISSRAFLDAVQTAYNEYMKKNNNKEISHVGTHSSATSKQATNSNKEGGKS